MLDRPNIEDAAIIEVLEKNYKLPIQKVVFLPLGADRNTAVYRADAKNGSSYFVKLRLDDFNEMSLKIPKLLKDQGVPHMIAPLSTYDGKIWAHLGPCYLSLYPYISGKNAYEAELSDKHWVEFGQTLKSLHTVSLPKELAAQVPKENFTGPWRTQVGKFLKLIQQKTFKDPISSSLAKLLKEKESIIQSMIQRSESFANILQKKHGPFVLCHGDIHAWNIMIQDDGTFYVTDWDTIILAPKERDLMFVASGLFGKKRSPQEEESLFYKGYGSQSQVDPISIAFYRYDRIIRDIAEYSEMIFIGTASDENKVEGFKQLSLQFEPGEVVELAFRSEKFLKGFL